MNDLQQGGVFVALWTPSDAAGRFDPAALARNLAWLKNQAVHGLLALGSTGEFPFFSTRERKQILERIIRGAGGKTVIANISDVSPRVACSLGKHAAGAGAKAVAILPPYFFKLSQADLAEFFIAAAAPCGLPVFLYNFPELSGTRISLETISKVARALPLAGIKQSGGEFDYHKQLVALGKEKNFVVFTGGEARLGEGLKLGVKGCVSGLGNVLPEPTIAVYNAFKKRGTALKAQQLLEQVTQLLDRVPFPMNVAALMQARGLSPGLPKTPLSRETAADCEAIKAEFRSLLVRSKLEPLSD